MIATVAILCDWTVSKKCFVWHKLIKFRRISTKFGSTVTVVILIRWRIFSIHLILCFSFKSNSLDEKENYVLSLLFSQRGKKFGMKICWTYEKTILRKKQKKKVAHTINTMLSQTLFASEILKRYVALVVEREEYFRGIFVNYFKFAAIIIFSFCVCVCL